MARKTLETSELADIGQQVADALTPRTRRGVARDIKPGNIFVGENGQVKVLDFDWRGVSKRRIR
jgi:serine/threonine protein kinase